MTYLLLQTFLLLLASYFLGAFVACAVKRAVFGARNEEPVGHSVYVPVAAAPIAVDAPPRPPVSMPPQPARRRAPPVVPRSIDPVQPRIDVLRRPEPRPIPKLVDPSRFERALMGPDPNEGMPRRAIPEIRPAVLMPITGDYQPGSYGPPEPPEPEIPPVPVVEVSPIEVEPQILDVETVPEDEAPNSSGHEAIASSGETTRRSRLSDATTSAAAAAVAVAKAAAAASVPMFRSLASRAEKAAPPEAEPQNTREDAEPGRDKAADKIVVEETALDTEAGNEDVAPTRNEDVEDEVIETAPIEEELSEEDQFEDQPFDEESFEEEDVIEQPRVPFPQVEIPQPARTLIEGGDDFQRIRAIGADLEQRLKSEGVDSFEHIAGWTADDVKRIGQLLGIPGRIDREQWIEQAQILAKGGETYYSRNRLAALKAATPAPETAADQIAERTSSLSQIPDASDELETAAESSEEANLQAVAEPEEEAAAEKEDEATAEPVADEPGDAVEPDIIEEPVKRPLESAAPSNLSGVLAASHGRSVAEMAAAAAAAIAAASASVTRGLKPIEPISPLSRVDPKISMPAKLSDAIKEKVAASASAQPHEDVEPPRPLAASSHGPQDDLKRIRGVGVLIEKRLNAMGISRYEQIANWTSGEIDRVSQILEFKGRIEREGWVEQARILLNGGQTEFSRRVDRGEVDTSRET